ncbi:MAG: LysM peptidoglycan-binding domain-containing protein [Peptoniphilus sp.]|uniref:LysM peptidoglycan-binding domain-containing protein n=1 Tax=Peptoniphilus sp. TaxID=1971214 RepID=UPI0025F7F3EC|nr:LysM peptidoglycan-binding domain-containing protein [Peptoniphilus sp.]MCI5642817.1 LysM peptidoglycan-binding domain-containing protein [Peptoniphilus sp.]MDD7352790.1 LysM peptidoglycan-binding domain-containing protein [Peptoniphilaceae bacterium]
MKRIIINKPKVFLFLLLIFIFNSGLVIKNFEDENSIMQEKNIIQVYTVKKGDTLWTISDNYEYKNKMKFIMEIENLNNISSYDIKPGYKLAIPIYKSK